MTLLQPVSFKPAHVDEIVAILWYSALVLLSKCRTSSNAFGSEIFFVYRLLQRSRLFFGR